MQKCFFIATSWYDGAIPDHFRALSNALAESGSQVVILAAGRRMDAQRKGNPIVYAWPSTRPVRFRDAVFLSRLIRRYRPDCVVANFGAVKLMIVVGWLMRVPVRVAWYHTLAAAIDMDGQTPSWKLGLLRLRSRIAYRAATHLVPVSEVACEELKRVFRVDTKKLKVLPNSLADPGWRLDRSQITRDRVKLVCVGRFSPVKGQDVLIRAVGFLKQRFPNVNAEFVGKGPLKASCEELARRLGVGGNCLFVGSAPHSQVLERMASAAATIVPSRIDNLPTVVIESLAVGTPVMASRVGGIPEMIRDGVEGFLVPPDDPVVLAEKLGLVLSDTDLAETMGRNAREHFLTRYEQTKVVQEQARWLSGLCALSQAVPAG